MKKNILVISPHFFPENFKCNDVAFELARRGYSVTVLSDIPNYPSGFFFQGYGLFKKRREVVNDVKIIRTAVIPRGDGSSVRLLLNYLSFLITASVNAVFMALFQHFDVVLVHESSPITVGIPGVIIKKLSKQTKLLFWVLDLWPESLQVAGGINNKSVLNFFARIAKLCYRVSDKILISSKGFRESICQKGDFDSKLEYFPNWAEESINASSSYILPELPEGFRVMFAGNLGESQDFENVLEAVKILRNRGRNDIHLILVGNGRKRPWIEHYIEEFSLSSLVHCLGYHPLDTMGLFFEKADVLFLALKDSLIFNLTCPAKLQAYMSSGKPILAMINGEGADIIANAKCGISVPAGNSVGLADALEQMSRLNSEDLASLGENGKVYCNKTFSFVKNMDNIEKMIN